MADLRSLGLSDALVGAAADIGWTRALPLQAAATPSIRRGGNAVLHASSGAGVTGAWALPLLDRLMADRQAGEQEAGGPVDHAAGVEPDPRAPAEPRRDAAATPRLVIVTATADRASDLASCLGRLAERTPLRVRALAAGWRTEDADVLTGSAVAVARGIAGANVKLGDTIALVVDGLTTIFGLGGGDALGTVLVSLPPDAQRVIVTSDRDANADRFIEGHARRALSFPARPADPKPASVVEPRGRVGYVDVAEHEKPAVLARLLGRAEPGVRVATRSAERAATVRSVLARRGIVAEVASFDTLASIRFAYDVPADADEARRLVPDAVVLVLPRELPHLRRVLAEAGLEPHATPEREPGGALARYREELRRAIQEQDLDAQMLILEPLLDEFAAAEVAAALSALLRERRAARPAEAAPGQEPVPAARTAAPPRPPAFVRLFVSAGQRDGVGPRDIVGAFTGEAHIAGDQIGKIDVRDTFSVVEVDSSVADRVILALNGTTLRSRALRVDYDRRGGPAPRRPARTPRPRPHT